ncbi:MAG TPA: hypothetical protein VJ624_05755 [Thermodesulfobacteriota bacterium]|nr:hypothetical protein [Thermodesulfobacteriota bacterium]
MKKMKVILETVNKIREWFLIIFTVSFFTATFLMVLNTSSYAADRVLKGKGAYTVFSVSCPSNTSLFDKQHTYYISVATKEAARKGTVTFSWYPLTYELGQTGSYVSKTFNIPYKNMATWKWESIIPAKVKKLSWGIKMTCKVVSTDASGKNKESYSGYLTYLKGINY